jgi:hypothetical protein
MSPPWTSSHTSRSTRSRRPAATGVHRDRQRRPDRPPTLRQVLDQLRPGGHLGGSGSWIGWVGRYATVTALADSGIGFCSLQEAIDTTTPGGKLVFHVFAALASSNATWSASGPAPGWPPPEPAAATVADPSVMTAHKIQVAQEMYASKQYTVAAIAKTVGVSRASTTATSPIPAADQTEHRQAQRRCDDRVVTTHLQPDRRGVVALPHSVLSPP